MKSISAGILEPALRRVDIDCEQQEAEIKKEHDRIINELESRGLRWSGAQLSNAADLCIRATEIRATMIWNTIKRFIQEGGIQHSPAMRDELVQYVRQTIESHLGPIRETYEHACKIAGTMGSATEEIRLKMEQGIARSLDKVDTEIDAFILSMISGRASTNPTALSYTFIGPVGAVQSGPGATATVHQSLGGEDQQAILHAIQSLENAIREHADQLESLRVDEILEILVDVRGELQQPKRNMTRIGVLLQAVAASVQTTAALEPALKMMKTALHAIGVPMS